MVLKIRNRDVATEEDSVNAALRSEGVQDMQDLSLEEKRQILQAIENSKEDNQQKDDFLEATEDVPDVSSTTIEKKSDANIIVQIDDSTDDLIIFNAEDGTDSSSGTNEIQTSNTFEEKQAFLANDSRCILQMTNHYDPNVNVKQKRLMDFNVLDHPTEDQVISFYEERLNQLREKRRNISLRSTWHFCKGSSHTREEHFNLVKKEMDDLATMSAMQHLIDLRSDIISCDNFHFQNNDTPIYKVLPYGIVPKEIPYSQLSAANKETASAKEENQDLNKSQPPTRSSLAKIAIKPRVVELHDKVEDQFKPGPSSRGNFSPIRDNDENLNTEKNSATGVLCKETKTECDKSTDLVDCPLCTSYFSKSSIQEHFDLCEQSRNTELVDGCCPFCNIELPIESLREKHMTKCLSKHKSGKLAVPVFYGAKRQADQGNEIISDSEGSEQGEEPPVKRLFTTSAFNK
ncbi:uncharacterized protein LOC135936585 [Cloeon dipterum]|uniref:uncharacterized protein LOC135936585 n=1 Tax=Cloeon dipterum TaxID=197152 RepID=UPI00321FAB6A